MLRTILSIMLISSLLMSCTKEGTDISNNNLKTLSYIELPPQVKRTLDNKIEVVLESDTKLSYSTDDKIEFQHYRRIVRNNWLKEVNNNDEYFIVGDKVYRIQGNKGSPFILHDNNIYYCSHNLHLDNYKEQKYYRVSLEK